jgi:hypothetical protein
MENNNNSGNQVFGNSGNVTINSTINNHSRPENNDQKMAADETWKDDAYTMVAQGQLKEAMASILKSSKKGEDVKTQVIQIMGRLSKLEIEIMAGTFSKQEEILELNQIRSAIIQLVANA